MSSHPDADAFMRKYLEEPTDATARLVFADWLEETGEAHNAAWAQFIRLKAEAGRYTLNSPERPALDRRADQYAPKIRARLTIPAALFVGYPRSLLQLLPPANIVVRLAGFEVPLAVLELMPESVARENLVLPLASQGRAFILAAADPRDADLVQKLEFILNRNIVLVGGEREDLIDAINREFGNHPTESVTEYLYIFPEPEPDLTTGNGSPVARLANLILTEAVHLGADRIHIFPEPDRFVVRYRIDDEWVERDSCPLRLLRPFTTRLAIMAGIPVEWTFADPPSLTPMTGEFPLQVHGNQFRVRVTIQPSPDGPTTQIDFLPDAPASF
jgi:type IV pilus assembly protein PilB